MKASNQFKLLKELYFEDKIFESHFVKEFLNNRI